MAAGSAAGTQCAAGSSTNSAGATSAAECLCLVSRISYQFSSLCLFWIQPGFGFQDGTCTACETGASKPLLGNTPCPIVNACLAARCPSPSQCLNSAPL